MKNEEEKAIFARLIRRQEKIRHGLKKMSVLLNFLKNTCVVSADSDMMYTIRDRFFRYWKRYCPDHPLRSIYQRASHREIAHDFFKRKSRRYLVSSHLLSFSSNVGLVKVSDWISLFKSSEHAYPHAKIVVTTVMFPREAFFGGRAAVVKKNNVLSSNRNLRRAVCLLKKRNNMKNSVTIVDISKITLLRREKVTDRRMYYNSATPSETCVKRIIQKCSKKL